MHAIDTVFFDWDGTLVDSAQTAFDAFRQSLGDLGIAVDGPAYERIYSPNWYAMYEALRLPREKWTEADTRWLHHYGRNPPRAAAGVPDVLNALLGKGYCLGIVSSGTRERVLWEIDELGLMPAFRVVVCGEDVGNKKPHPEGLDLAMERVGKTPEACCYVGDTAADMEMGRRAGVRTIGVRSRYPGSRELIHSGPDLCIESMGELLACFRS